MTLQPGVTYRVMLVHRAGEPVISGSVYTNGQFCAAMSIPNGNGTVGDFQSRHAFRQQLHTTMAYGDSVLAHGTVGNLAFASPLPVDKITNLAAGQVQFASDTNWLYTLEQSADFQTWTPAAPAALATAQIWCCRPPICPPANPFTACAPICHERKIADCRLPVAD